ncbi:MAG: hypothetical protein ACKO13_13165, partial [Cytophagales bacterium]
MKRLFLLFWLINVVLAHGQAVTGLNFSHWYNPQNEVDLQLRLVRGPRHMVLHYTIKSVAQGVERYSVQWEKRASFSSREVLPVNEKDSTLVSNPYSRQGQLIFELPQKAWLLLAKVVNTETQKAWYYFKVIEPIYPASGWLANADGWLNENYLQTGKSYSMKNATGKVTYVSFYKRDFSPPLPPFSEKASPTDQFLFYDSIFQLTQGSTFSPKREGLYLFQQDTSAAEGFALRANDPN